MARISKAQIGCRVGRDGRSSCGIERAARKEERQAVKEERRYTRQNDRELKREERQTQREERKAPKMRSGGKTPAWTRSEGKSPSGGLNKKGIASYRRQNPGSKLSMAVTESNPTGKRAKRRASFCRRMKGMRSKLTSAKTARDPNSRINKSLRKWKC